jgi:glyoxylase-like metal-dependent hydrolase (beta-lactamase superfamily II)
MPADELEAIINQAARMGIPVPTFRPDVVLEGGERLDWSPFRFEVIWTPGHTAGLVCLYDPQFAVLISSDHVLEHSSPHIGHSDEPDGDPLGDYLRSLQVVRDLPTSFVLPGHGKPIANLAPRVDELEEHHLRRLKAVLLVLTRDEQTAYDVASHISWKHAQDGWQRLSLFERSSALDETCAHLDYLVKRQQISRQVQDGVAVHQRSTRLPVDASLEAR